MHRRSIRRCAASGIAGVALMSGCSGSPPAPPSATMRAPSIADIARASAVDIRATGCRPLEVRGAGAVVMGGYILTAAHVVAGSTSITVRPAAPTDAGAVKAVLVAIDPANDLALLSPQGLGLAPLPLGMMQAQDEGVAIIFRDGAGIAQPFTVARQVVVRILDIYGEAMISRDGYRVDISILPGDSGAVLVGPDGAASGVLYAKSRAEDNRAWAADTSTVATLVRSAAAADPRAGIRTGKCAA